MSLFLQHAQSHLVRFSRNEHTKDSRWAQLDGQLLICGAHSTCTLSDLLINSGLFVLLVFPITRSWQNSSPYQSLHLGESFLSCGQTEERSLEVEKSSSGFQEFACCLLAVYFSHRQEILQTAAGSLKLNRNRLRDWDTHTHSHGSQTYINFPETHTNLTCLTLTLNQISILKMNALRYTGTCVLSP